MRTRVMFDGHELTADYYVSNLRTSLLPRTIGTKEVSGRDGAVFTGVKLAQRTITLTLTAVGKSVEERHAAARRLAALLAVSEPRPLQISIDDGLYYMAVPQSSSDATRWVNAISFEVTFACPDPVAYGMERTVIVPAGGSATFFVGGTYQTMPHVLTEMGVTGNNKTWNLALEDGSYLYYKAPNSSVSRVHTLSFDCEDRVFRANGVVSRLVLGADWLVFEPGEHTLDMGGTSVLYDAEVTFTERWL